MTIAEPTTTREALDLIARRDGVLTPTAVVTEAKNEASPLHHLFEWDDTEAARKYRLDQAAGIIRRFKVIVPIEEDRIIRVRAYSSVGGSAYRLTEEALLDPIDHEFIMAQALRELTALRLKYAHLIDFDAVLRSALGES